MLYREQIDKSRVPAHVAIIMDGNGRWAKQRGQIRSFGHQAGAETVENTFSPPMAVYQNIAAATRLRMQV